MSDPIQILIKELEAQCNTHTNGVCQTRACLVRGGWTGGVPEFATATCIAKKQAVALIDLQSQLAALKLVNERLVGLVGRVSSHVICHLPTCGNGDCTCGLTTLHAEIELVKGKTI